MKKNNFSTYKKGFTIIEMMVSIAIFMVVITMGMTAILTMINVNKRSQANAINMSNMSLAIEAMTKSIRVGTNYSGSDSCGDGTNSSLTFNTTIGNGTVTYSFNTASAYPHQIIRTIGGGTPTAITGTDVSIDNVCFRTSMASGGQPQVLILIHGYSGDKPEAKSAFYLQSLVSQRLTAF